MTGDSLGTLREDGRERVHGVRLGIIAAMEREVAPLIRGWKVREIEQMGGGTGFVIRTLEDLARNLATRF